jgi:hypothetical protein
MMAKGQIKQKQDNISKVLFENLCSIQCTKEEICSVLNVSEKTLNSWCNSVYGGNFSLVFAKKREYGKSSLRRTQWKLAERNTAMAIWLGKQYLDQRDKQEIETNQNIKVDNPYKNLTEEELKRLAGD